ncbi:MAG: hypothetical protein LPK85_03875, partial [Gammaproteobacteria bacterium]|nr:hypothetical protein [Gammaproteobacteria bacterium]
MSDRKQFILVMIIAALFVGWLSARGLEVIRLNDTLQDDAELRNYPYPFRVLRVESGTAVMTTLRSPDISTREALQYLFPGLRSLSDTHREWQRAEREFARLHAKASEIIMKNERVERVRWELDENWYYLEGFNQRLERP